MAINTSSGAVLGGGLRVLAALIGRKPIPKKHLHARVGMRGIVSELPAELPLKIVDHSGRTHQGVYALNVLIWNKGSQEITPADFLDNAPLRLAIGDGSYIIMADSLSNDDQLLCSTSQVDERNVEIYFDCINPGDHLNIILFYGGKSFADIEVLGRIRGQETPIDSQAEEVKASLGERLLNLGVLMFIMNMFIGLPLSSWFIYRDYSFEQLLKPQPDIPMTIMGSFGIGLALVFMYIYSRIGMWWERRKYPLGYPLNSDFEPPFWENIKGMFSTVFLGKKHRFSTSMFDWAKPVILRGKKNKRRKVDDWMA